ncbi:flagellar hook-length control protein FliK [Glaciecola petra]|uniref:Flagellar hook-length control protein FliK n=1 Tax=Glaciecola petra TaxID=3075602 RepID=A0ABU2ZN95_9ALTE|nr:flagellar hook-length control protein FliK [Aestuariibacter sp. P117]MDT0593814.1 flagellar hook-length control protein FliK [Aestuariibacter sp. P117]
MMQQIASKQPDSAASVLPLEVKAEATSKSAFHEALDLHQDSKSNTSMLNAVRDDRRQDASADTNASFEQSEMSLRNTKNTQEATEQISPNNKNEKTGKVERGQTSSNDKAETLDATNIDQDKKNSEQEIKSSKIELARQGQQEVAQDQTNKDKQQKAEFDFISYVSKVAEFESGRDISDAKEFNNIDDKSVSANAIKIFDDLLVVSQQASLDASEQNQVQLEISLVELQLLQGLQAGTAEANQATQVELSVVDEDKVKALISSMLLQLQKDSMGTVEGELQNNTKIASQTFKEMIDLDKTLMEQIMGAKAVEANGKAILASDNELNAQGIAQINVQANTTQNNTESLITSNVITDETIVNDKTLAALPRNETLNKSKAEAIAATFDIENTELKKGTVITQGLDAELALSNQDEIDDNVLSKMSQRSTELANKTAEQNKVIISVENTKAPLNNILALEEDKLQATLANLKERLENTAQALKTPEKGNEFIAALQAGVKEFKQQLGQGREPGIDLNALAEKALSSAAIESDQAIKLKVEEAVKQVNAVLNLANAINSTSAQLQASVQNVSNNDIAGNISQVEGTKIANGVNMAANTNSASLSQQAVIDRAINIFKADGQQQLAEKVRWMVNAKNATAEIRLDPPDLGGMQIKVNLSGDSAQVNFSVQSNAAKEALDQAVPRLRDMLQEQGIELGESSVEQGNDQQQFASNEQEQHANSDVVVRRQDLASDEQVSDNEVALETPIINQRIHSNGIAGIDYYA